jgi:hypothetical protein
MATVQPEIQPSPQVPVEAAGAIPVMRIYGHSSLVFWWPVWVVGFLFAFLSWVDGRPVKIGPNDTDFHLVWMYTGKDLGVIYVVVLFLVILIANVTVRGLASVVVILTLLFLTVLFAYLGWWEIILSWMPSPALYMNMGFYLFFSTLLFLAWALAFFIFDRMDYWVLCPGQMTHMYVVGGAEKSYDTRGMVFEKIQSDLFRHRILGLGSGDIRIITSGAHHMEAMIPNVLFVTRRLQAMQELVTMKPNQNEGAPPAQV